MKMIPREIAKDLIRTYVERGDDLNSLMRGQMGCSGPNYSAQIGGYATLTHGYSYKDNKKWESTKLKRDEIAVTRIGRKECLYIFKLKKIFDEIKSGQLSLTNL